MKRSISLDIFKMLLSILIIALHMQPALDNKSLLDWQFFGFTRLAVPCFFIINGYFLFSKITDRNAIKKYIIHLIIIYCVWSFLYFLTYYNWDGLTKKLLFYRLFMGYHHLWYLPALIFATAALYFIRKKINKDIYILAIVAILYFIAHLDEVSQVIPDLFISKEARQTFVRSEYIYRNGLFMGLPFITIGYLIRKWNFDKIFKSWHLILLSIISLGTLALETNAGFSNREVHEFSLSILLFGPCMILLFSKHPLLVKRATWTEYFGYIPNGIYYVHIYMISVVYSINYHYYNIPIVFVSSVLVTIGIIFVNRRVKIFL